MTICLPVRRRRGKPAARSVIALAGSAFVCAALAGCKSGIDASGLTKKENDQLNEMTKTDDIHGPLERFMSAAGWGNQEKKKVQLVNPPEAMAAYHRAEDLMNQKKYSAAQKVFWKEVAEKYKDYPIREDSVFMAGECFFLMERYADAQDRYDRVIKDFQTTRHLDEISRRKFEIARIWLGFPDIVTAEDVKPVNFEEPSTKPPQTSYQEPTGLTYSVPIFPNFRDKRRPVFDTQGRALEALKSIWLNDPTGALADDALMLSASYYLRKGDYTEADHLYELLRKEFPKSPHVENAYVLGAHVKLMSYQGPEYDGAELDEARKLKEETLKRYPNRSDRARIEGELKKIELAKAAQIWADVEYWKAKRKPRGIAQCCKEVIKRYPESHYAQMAREQLAKLRPEDKLDKPLPVPKDYEEKSNPGKTAVGDEPGDLEDPGSPPKQLPPGEKSAGQVRM